VKVRINEARHRQTAADIDHACRRTRSCLRIYFCDTTSADNEFDAFSQLGTMAIEQQAVAQYQWLLFHTRSLQLRRRRSRHSINSHNAMRRRCTMRTNAARHIDFQNTCTPAIRGGETSQLTTALEIAGAAYVGNCLLVTFST